MRIGMAIIGAAFLGLTGDAFAQESTGLERARQALAECARYSDGPAEDRTGADSKAAFERAEREFRAAIAAAPRNADAHAGLGQVLSRCGIPHASMTTIMNVVEESARALNAALAIDPEHWDARFTLALNSYHMPAFMNQLPVAVRELETLLRQQNGRADRPEYAMTYLFLGDAYRKVGREEDARAAYAAGVRLFPAHEALRQRAQEAGAPQRDTTLTLQSSAGMPQVMALAPLRVEGTQHQLEDGRSSTSLRRLDVYTMPGGTGEMLQTLQALPGVTRAGDGADLYVRGGDPEETPVFVNGGRLAFPGRWEGLNGSSMGVLDASVLSRAFFSAGAFSAKFGNALSGVVDVETRGRPTEASWRVGVNTVSAAASLNRPVSARGGAWGTAMLTDVSLVTRMHGTSSTYPDVPRSYQALVGGSYNTSPSLELKVVGVVSGDESARIIDTGGYEGAFRSSGSTLHGAASARWLRDDGRVGVLANVSASRREGGFTFGLLRRDRSDDALGSRVDVDVVAGDRVRVRGGAEITRFGALTSGRVPLTRDLNPGSPSTALDGVQENAWHVGAYAEVERQLTRSVVAVGGVRADHLPGSDDISLDPRVALAYSSGAWTLRSGAGVFSQGSWRRTYRLPDGGTPSGAPTRGRHLVLGAERGGEPAVRVETWAKWYDSYAASEDSGPSIREARSMGLDAIVRWQRQSRLNGWITYSLLDSDVMLADGGEVPGRFDVTHTLTGVARLAVTSAWELGSTLRYASGKPYTEVMGTTPSSQDGWPDEPVFGDIHGDRLPHYLRLDGRITRYQRIAGRTGVFYLEMLALNGRRNIIAYQYDSTFSRRIPVESFFARRTFVVGAELGF